MSDVRGRGLGDGKTGVRSASVGERRKLEALVSIRLLEAIRSKDSLKAGPWSKAVSTSMVILLLAIFIFKIQDVSRILLGIFYIFDIVLLAVSKGLV